jgi:hypothetical protein
MSDSHEGANVFLLTVQGTPRDTTIEAVRDLHNATAGAPQSIAGARALGDLSHNVFVPAGQLKNTLLFIDTWNNPAGVGQFFSDHQVVEAAGKLFAERAATLWKAAEGFGNYTLPAPTGRSVHGVGMLRANITSVDAARPVFHADAGLHIKPGRLDAQVGHQVWLPVPMPGAEPVLEVLALDFWLDADQMTRHYDDGYTSTLGPAFTGAPQTSIWKSAGSDWIEW